MKKMAGIIAGLALATGTASAGSVVSTPSATLGNGQTAAVNSLSGSSAALSGGLKGASTSLQDSASLGVSALTGAISGGSAILGQTLTNTTSLLGNSIQQGGKALNVGLTGIGSAAALGINRGGQTLSSSLSETTTALAGSGNQDTLSNLLNGTAAKPLGAVVDLITSNGQRTDALLKPSAAATQLRGVTGSVFDLIKASGQPNSGSISATSPNGVTRSSPIPLASALDLVTTTDQLSSLPNAALETVLNTISTITQLAVPRGHTAGPAQTRPQRQRNRQPGEAVKLIASTGQLGQVPSGEPEPAPASQPGSASPVKSAPVQAKAAQSPASNGNEPTTAAGAGHSTPPGKGEPKPAVAHAPGGQSSVASAHPAAPLKGLLNPRLDLATPDGLLNLTPWMILLLIPALVSLRSLLTHMRSIFLNYLHSSMLIEINR